LKDKIGILVVEDDRDINELIAYNLMKEGFAVTSVYDGLDARETLELEKFDIVILDIMLPGLGGFDICRLIRNNPKEFNTFILVVSAKVDSQDKLYAHILGADCYLTKPFSIARLIEIIKEVVFLKNKEFVVKA